MLSELLAGVLGDGTGQPLGRAFGPILESLHARQAEIAANDATMRAAWALAVDVAPLMGLTAQEVFTALGRVPDDMLALLDTSQGWATLAGHVAGALNCPLPDYRPALH